MMPPESPFKSLRRRILNAYLLFSLGCSLFFVSVTAIVIEGIELRLVDERLKEVAQWAAPRHAGNLPVEMPSAIGFYQGATIPQSLRNLPEGVHDVTVDGLGLHVYASQNAAGPFVVVDHESDYEKVEVAVYTLLGLGFLGFAGMSVLLGWFMARRFVTPIIALSNAVTQRSASMPLTGQNDELGVLARAFAAYTHEMGAFLERERLFTGDVSHELRTPLTVISGAAEILMEQTQQYPALRAPVVRIARAAGQASASIGVLLLLARRPELSASAPVSIAELAHDEVARHQHLLASKPVTLSFAPGPGPVLRAPRELLSAMLGNLIRNACQYTEHGTVTVWLEAHALHVDDTGPGLPAGVRAMLTGDAGAGQFSGSAGSGLGLGLVRRICEYLGASLDVAIVPAGGSAFTIHFPANEILTPP
jgi:signal transduction histidine kinase